MSIKGMERRMSRCDPWSLFGLLFPNIEDPENPGQYLCRFCGKPTTETRRRYYCGDSCYWNCMKMCSWPWLRRDIMKRDNNQCIICGKHVGRGYHQGEVHHIIPVAAIWDISWKVVREWGYTNETLGYRNLWAKVYTALFMDPNNLITLCINCHNKVHAGEIHLGAEDTEKWWVPQKTLEGFMGVQNVRE